jgi:hypothetical protein
MRRSGGDVHKEAVSPFWQSLYEVGLIAMVVQRVANFAYGVVQSLGSPFARSPYGVQEFLPRYQFARLGGESEQDLHRLGRKMGGTCSANDLALTRVDKELTQVEAP